MKSLPEIPNIIVVLTEVVCITGMFFAPNYKLPFIVVLMICILIQLNTTANSDG